jgi:hypothetical protein
LRYQWRGGALFAALVIALAGPAEAQTRSISGRALAAEDSTALAGVAVEVIGIGVSATTDTAGRYMFESLPSDSLTVVFSRLGVVPDSLVVTPTQTVLIVYLEQAAVQLAGLTVETSPQAVARERFEESAQASAVTIGTRDIQNTPTFLEADVIRTIQLLPGTGAVNDFTVGYNARGGEVDQNLIQLDGITIFNPSHLGGVFSTFDAQAVGEVEYLKGGFPSSYSGRLSSVLDVRTRSGSPDFGVMGQVSLLSSKLLVEGSLPIEGSSFLIAGRRTYADKVIETFTSNELPYYFADAVGKLSFPLPTGGTLEATGYWGRDILDWASGASDTDGRPLRLRVDWGNRLGGLTWRESVLGLPLEVSGSVTEFSTRVGLDPSIVSLDNEVRLRTGKAALTLTPGRSHEIRIGGGVEDYAMSYDIRSEALAATYLDQDYAPRVWSFFVDDVWKPNERFIIRPGVRMESVGGGAGQTVWSPRLSAKAFLTEDFALTGSAGRYHQAIHSLRDHNAPWSFVDFRIGADEFTPVGRSDHLVLGFEQWLRPNLSLTVEGYRKTFDDILNVNITDDLTVQGDEFVKMTGVSWGVDAMLRRYSGRWNGWVSYSLGKSERTDPFQTFAPAHDRRHMLNIVLTGPGPLGSEMSTRWGFGTAMPYTPIIGQWEHRSYHVAANGFGGVQDTEVIADPVLNAERYPAYSRLDISFRWNKRLWGGDIHPFVQLVNLYNRRNVFLYVFDLTNSPGTRETLGQMPFFPTFGVEFKF